MTIKNNQQLRIKHIEAALRAARGNVLLAARMLQRARQTIYRRIQDSEHLQRVQDELLEEELDLHEGKLRQMGFDKDNVTALLAFLNAKGKHRGYGQHKFEVKGEVGHKHDHVHRRAEDLSDAEAVEEWRRISKQNQIKSIN